MGSVPFALGFDSGFASLGFAVVEIGEVLVPWSVGVVRTEKKSGKVADNNMRRGGEITRQLAPLFAPGLLAVFVEAQSLPRNASVSAQLGIFYGVIIALSELHDAPLVSVPPKELKKAICGTGSASKKEVKQALDQRFGCCFADRLIKHGVPPGQHEHAYDALGTVVASEFSELLRLARRIGD